MYLELAPLGLLERARRGHSQAAHADIGAMFKMFPVLFHL